MFTPKVIKAVPAKVNRSGFHHLVIRDSTGTAQRRDILGVVLVAILTAAVVFLARIVLAH